MAKHITYTPHFKKKVVLAALKENKTLLELAQEFKIHSSQIIKWRSQAIEGLEELFEDGRQKRKEPETDIEALYAQLGKAQAKLEFLKKKPELKVREKRSLIELGHPELDIKAQCEALDLSRSSYYYEPIRETEENLRLMKRMEEMHLETLAYGYRKVYVDLRKEGYAVNEKRIERLWALLGFRSILPGPNLSKSGEARDHYPYLLNGLWVDRPYRVFSADITYIPVKKGFVYLVSVTEWFSRSVLSWEVSNTLCVDFCIRALEKALEKGVPIYFNTDQGAQFTSAAFIEVLKKNSIKISMDGVGRCIDNIYQERGWWALKYEKI